MAFTSRLATYADIDAIKDLMALSMGTLLKDVLTPAQVAKSNESMGLDTQLLDDGTYFMIYDGDTLVGCGGWSRRRTYMAVITQRAVMTVLPTLRLKPQK